MRRLTMVIMVLGGCASASLDNGGNPGDDSGTPTDDAGADGSIDAAPDAVPIDAAPMQVTVTQSTSPAMVSGNTIVCGYNGTPYTAENRFYRVFPLADHGITGPLQVQNVQFGVEESQGSHTVTVNVGTYAGAIAANTAALDTAQWAPMATASVAIPNGAGLTIVAPIALTIPAGSKMMVEILSPDNNDRFFPASNPSGQTYPSFRRSTCNNAIQSYATSGFPNVHLVMSVTGLH